MIYKQRMEQKLRDALQPERLDVLDESHHHVGHAGAHPQGESHFRIQIVSAAFAGKSQVARQRLVYDLLADELRERVHALSLETKAPGEG